MRSAIVLALLMLPVAAAVQIDVSVAVQGDELRVTGTVQETAQEAYVAMAARAPGFATSIPDGRGTIILFEDTVPELPPPPPGIQLKAFTPTRPIAHYEAVIANDPLPGQSDGIRPGAHLLMTMKGESGTFGCTANFIWRDAAQRKLYLGAAGHCFMPQDKTSTHGSGKDWNRHDTHVRVCVSNCQYGGNLGFVFTGDLVDLGPVAYARQITGSSEVGHDFGVVEIPEKHWKLVDPAMAVWGGPDRLDDVRLGDTVVLYGNAGGFGEVWPTMARAGVGAGSSAKTWGAFIPSFQGDSGSALNTARVAGADVVGDGAAGILTHLGFADGGVVVGTTVPRAIQMAAEAGLALELVLVGQAIPGFSTDLPAPPTNVQATAGDGRIHVTWDVDPAGAVPDSFIVRYGEVPGGPYTDETTVTTESATIEGLDNGSPYYVVVFAENAAGRSEASAEATAVPSKGQVDARPPSAPGGLVGIPDEGAVDLSWDPPSDDGGADIVWYTVYFGDTDGGPYDRSMRFAAAGGRVDGLGPGEHFFVVAAHNGVYEGARSAQHKATPFEAAEPIRIVEARLDGGVWERALFDGQRFEHAFQATGGDHVVTARLMQGGVVLAESDATAAVQQAASTKGTPMLSTGLLVAALFLFASRRP